ncbi:MAG: deoxyribose-phosphate aldolase [Chitinophagales bacterium]|nr:deoxyribose-phosphate aldolase [Chitinophagales bacterium]
MKIELNKTIDHTNLKPNASTDDFIKLCDEAILYNFKSVCVPPSWVEFCADRLRNEEVVVCTVIGFPLGYSTTQTKIYEVKNALENGADEIDLVVNISAVKSNLWEDVEDEIQLISMFVKNKNKLLKVIFETAYLSDAEIIQLCTICSTWGVAFVKTSTGFGPAGAKIEQVRLMKANINPSMQVKASGGIRNYEEAKAMIEAGAGRLGTSSGVIIIQEFKLQ